MFCLESIQSLLQQVYGQVHGGEVCLTCMGEEGTHYTHCTDLQNHETLFTSYDSTLFTSVLELCSEIQFLYNEEMKTGILSFRLHLQDQLCRLFGIGHGRIVEEN